MANENLSYPLLLSEVNQGSRRIASIENMNGRTELMSNSKVLVESGLIVRRKIRLADVSNEQVAVETVRVPFTAFKDRTGIGSWRDADKNTLVNSPVFYDLVGFKVC